MRRFLTICGLILMGLAGAGCSAEAPSPVEVPTLAVEAAVEQQPAAATAEPIPLPPTNTPAAAPPVEVVSPAAELESALPIEADLAEIDGALCAELAEAEGELAQLRAEGADVAELEAAVAELRLELERCR